MKTRTIKKTESKPKFSLTKWSTDHKEFVAWWKEHEHSGFVEDSEGGWHWNFTPRLAWNCARYRSEFTGEDEYATKEEMQR
ncbi:MAG TPA: hypothetical protein VFH87_01735 [Candidatus Udaeobacter sp.]|nr:hypothetical protein [Candidatus Udaeobacter sp.]